MAQAHYPPWRQVGPRQWERTVTLPNGSRGLTTCSFPPPSPREERAELVSFARWKLEQARAERQQGQTVWYHDYLKTVHELRQMALGVVIPEEA